MKRWISILLIPLSVAFTACLLEGAAHLFPLPVKDTGLENAMDPWGMSLFSCVPDEKLGYRLKPGAAYGKLSINEHGYVGGPFEKRKTPGAYRIVCVGGSTTFCTDVRGNEFAWPARLEAMLNAAGDGRARAEVINAGVPGYHSWHTRERLDELLALDPDLVLLMDGFNDVNASAGLKDSALGDITKRGLLTALAGEQPDWRDRLAAMLGRSRAFTLARSFMDTLRQGDFSAGMERKVAAFNTEANLRHVLARLERDGRQAVLLNHPWSVHGTDPAFQATEQERLVPGMPVARPDAVKTYMWGRGYVRGLNERLSREAGTLLLDPQPALDAATACKRQVYTVFFRDIVHLTEHGNSIMAAEVFKGLAANEGVKAALGIDPALAKAVPERFAVAAQNVAWGGGWLRITRTDVPVSRPEAFNALDHPGQVDGWGYHGPREVSSPARLSFGVLLPPGKENLLFFLPRMTRDGRVEVFLHQGGARRSLRAVEWTGPEDWSPIAARHVLDLSGLEGECILEFVLDGGSAQLWHDPEGNALFFR